MEKIIQELADWSFIDELQHELYGFLLEKQFNARDNKYLIFRYHNEETKRNFSVLYDGATKEFIARVTIGLTEFCDIRFIVGSREALEKVLREKLDNTLKDLAYFNINNIDCIVQEKKIVDWSYIQQLPKKIGDFTLFIAPNEPVKVINGSYILVDYCDFNSESNLTIYYNIFRDEFFGEVRVKRSPRMTADFDAKTLDELEEKLKERLVNTLDSITAN